MRYFLDLRQFNNKEESVISFVVFEHALNYAFHKLRESIEIGAKVVKAVTIKGPKGRRIIVIPTVNELVPPIINTAQGDKVEQGRQQQKLIIELALNENKERYFLF